MYNVYLDFTWPVQRMSLVPYAGTVKAPDVWSEEAIACIAELIHARGPAKKDCLCNSRMWKGVTFIPYSCFNSRLSWTDDIYILQANGLDGVVNSSCRLAGFYTIVDGIPCVLSMCGMNTVTGYLTGFVYHAGQWFDSINGPCRRLYAVDRALTRLGEAIEDSFPKRETSLKCKEFPEVPFDEHIQPYLARMRYAKGIWQSYLTLKKDISDFLWEGGSLQDVVDGVNQIIRLSRGVSECAREKADELKSEVIEFNKTLQEQS